MYDPPPTLGEVLSLLGFLATLAWVSFLLGRMGGVW